MNALKSNRYIALYFRIISTINRNLVTSIFAFGLLLLSCNDDGNEIEYADGYPNKLAGNWIVFEFPGGNLEDRMSAPYSLVTALDPNTNDYLVFDNLYNSKLRIKADILGDTGFYANKTTQLEVINKGGFGIEKVSIFGYSNDNYVLKDFLYSLATNSLENMSFSISDIEEVMFFRAGFYDKYDALVDTVVVFGYRKTGLEDVDYND